MIVGIQKRIRLQDDIIIEMIKNEYDVKKNPDYIYK